MSIEIICREVSRIMRKYDEPDPWKLAEAMGIIVQVMPLGSTEKSCKGFFLRQSRKKHITINSDLPEPIQRIILAHEIGHAVLHREAAKMRAFHDFALYDTSSQMEYEANLFAAEYLLEDDEVIIRLEAYSRKKNGCPLGHNILLIDNKSYLILFDMSDSLFLIGIHFQAMSTHPSM